MVEKSTLRLTIAIGLLTLSVGCAQRRVSRQPIEADLLTETQQAAPAPERDLPPGIERMCWHEPKVAVQQQGPGLDSEGKWYHPSYQAVRLAKGGHWAPCEPATSGRAAENR